VAAALMVLVALSCTALCFAWSIPSWRRRLAGNKAMSLAHEPETGGLTGWPARFGSVLILSGLVIVAAIAWYSSYSVLVALLAASR